MQGCSSSPRCSVRILSPGFRLFKLSSVCIPNRSRHGSFGEARSPRDHRGSVISPQAGGTLKEVWRRSGGCCATLIEKCVFSSSCQMVNTCCRLSVIRKKIMSLSDGFEETQQIKTRISIKKQACNPLQSVPLYVILQGCVHEVDICRLEIITLNNVNDQRTREKKHEINLCEYHTLIILT